MLRLRFLPVLIFLLFFLFWGCNSLKNKNDQPENEIKDSFEALLQLAAQQPENADIFHELALYYLARENFNDALHNINKSLELEPKNTKYYITFSDIYLLMGNIEHARFTLYKALDIDEENDEIYVNIGKLHIYTEDYPQAFENLRKALELNKNNSEAYFWRGMAWLENYDTIEAINDWQIAVARDPEKFDYYYYLGILLSERKDRFATDYLDHALRLSPENTEILYVIGMAFHEIESYNKAIETYKRILEINSCDHRALFNIGYINLVENENYDEAIRYFSEALNCYPEYADALYNRGLAYEQMMNFGIARKDYEEVLKISINYQKAIDALNRLDKNQQ